MSVRIILAFTLTVTLLVSVCDGKRGRKTKTEKITPLFQTAKDIKEALDPAQIVQPTKKFNNMDLDPVQIVKPSEMLSHINLDPAQIVKPSKKFNNVDMAKLTENRIVNENMKLSTQLVSWLNRVVDVGQGIANGVCRTVKLI